MKVKEVISNLLKSFTTDSGGFSARKLSAFAGVLTAIYVTLVLLPKTEQINALYAWLCFALLCLGIVTFEQIIRLKEGNKDEADLRP